MGDFWQHGAITTLHDLGTSSPEYLETMLNRVTQEYKLGLVLPVTASDMRAAPFANIMQELTGIEYIDQVVVVLNVAPDPEDYRECQSLMEPLGSTGHILWTDGPRVQNLYEQLDEAGFYLGSPGKGRSVWAAFGYLLADPRLQAFILHDCDIVNYRRDLVARLCLPIAHPSLDFDYVKAYYARTTDRMHGRVVRLLVSPLLSALMTGIGYDPFLTYMDSFRYPLSGEFSITAKLARSNRIPSDWGLEVGTLAEVFRNTSTKRVCQVDLAIQYEHKHQDLSLEDPTKGLMKMATDILMSIFRTLASRGTLFQPGHFAMIRSAYLRHAQDAIRQYHADALMNGLVYDRHVEEHAIEAFAERISVAGELFMADPAGGESIPNWVRVRTAIPDFPHQLRAAAQADAEEFA